MSPAKNVKMSPNINVTFEALCEDVTGHLSLREGVTGQKMEDLSRVTIPLRLRRVTIMLVIIIIIIILTIN